LFDGLVGIDLDVAYGIASLGRPVTNAIVMRVFVNCSSKAETKRKLICLFICSLLDLVIVGSSARSRCDNHSVIFVLSTSALQGVLCL
jgi:hypothetical protein